MTHRPPRRSTRTDASSPEPWHPSSPTSTFPRASAPVARCAHRLRPAPLDDPPVSPTRVAASKPSSKQPLSFPIDPSQTVRGSPLRSPTLTRPARRAAAKPSRLTLARAAPTDSCELDNFQRVSVLAEALPYLQRFAGQTVVVKYGGAAMTDKSLKDRVIKDLVLLSTVGIRPILVHGGGPEINGWLKKVGIEPKVSLFYFNCHFNLLSYGQLD